MMVSNDEFTPKWPEGLDRSAKHTIHCSEKTRGEQSASLSVIIIDNGDICLESIQRDYQVDTFDRTEVWTRNALGGGVCPRTHQALLMLAKAIQLDNEDLAKIQKEKSK